MTMQEHVAEAARQLQVAEDWKPTVRSQEQLYLAAIAHAVVAIAQAALAAAEEDDQ